MVIGDFDYQRCLSTLKKEMIRATGCTEPGAVAYAVALAKKLLGAPPKKILLTLSGGIIKNAACVSLPGLGNIRGLRAAAAAGAAASDTEKKLEIIASLDDQEKKLTRCLYDQLDIVIAQDVQNNPFFISARLFGQENEAEVRIEGSHTNLVYAERNGTIVFTGEREGAQEAFDVPDIQTDVEFADCCLIEDIRPLMSQEVKCNWAIAEKGMREASGASIGRLLYDGDASSVRTRAKAYAAAGSDARMGGTEYPVIINSGSGNQGITVSVPLIVYAKEFGSSEEKLYRALALSNLTAITQRHGFGTLSPFCGAVCAGAAAGAGIAYLYGMDYNDIAQTIINSLAILSGVVCDGAKASCAAKVSAAVDAGITGFEMVRKGIRFQDGEGFIAADFCDTMSNLKAIALQGMRGVNDEILSMLER
ncbi:MAG: L-serine ammonia-lyase, iron-sulfur-dependent, subunit alpha [Clostridiaceae bacterium]|nr:L-serine ammonia-lyase, iron-sulfur-dependent, subunit alpha [Clostridiaceae bacterium]